MGREAGEAGEVECSGTGEVEDSKRNQLEKEQSWENKACGKDFSCESVEVGTEEMTWDGYEGTSMGGQRATDYSVNSEESGYSSLKDKQVGSYRGLEEEEKIQKIREEEVMVKELVRIAKEEEIAMERLNKVKEEEEQKLEEAQRAHESILAIEAARKVRQSEAEEMVKERRRRAEEKRLKDKVHRARRQKQKREIEDDSQQRTLREDAAKKERVERALERSLRQGQEEETRETEGEAEAEGQLEECSTKKERAYCEHSSEQSGSTLGKQARETRGDRECHHDLAEEGVAKIVIGTTKKDETHISKSGVKRSETNKKKEDNSKVALEQSGRLEEGKKMNSKPLQQDQGTEVVDEISNKDDLQYSGEYQDVNFKEKLPHRENDMAVDAAGVVTEVHIFLCPITQLCTFYRRGCLELLIIPSSPRRRDRMSSLPGW